MQFNIKDTNIAYDIHKYIEENQLVKESTGGSPSRAAANLGSLDQIHGAWMDQVTLTNMNKEEPRSFIIANYRSRLIKAWDMD